MRNLAEPLGIGEAGQMVAIGKGPVTTFASEDASYCLRTSRGRHEVTTPSLMGLVHLIWLFTA
jgi:hypothetical protein